MNKMLYRILFKLRFRQDRIKIPVKMFEWCDSTGKIEKCLIQILLDFVEWESAEMEYEGNKLWFLILDREARAELGIKWLAFQAHASINELNIPVDEEKHLKIIELYRWFRFEYTLCEFYDLHSHEFIEEKFQEIVKLKNTMWT